MIPFRLRRWLRRHWRASLLLVFIFLAGFGLVYFGVSFGKEAVTGWFAREPLIVSGERALLGDPYDLEGYTRVQMEVFADGVLFKDKCTGVWIAMPYEKTFSIKRGAVGVLDIRPTQHDLMYDIFKQYAINMTYARIERVEHDFYYATMLLETDEKLLQVDTRPSDALALAARFGAPVYMSDKLLRQKGVQVCRDQT